METRLCAKTGQHHPYDKVNDYLSQFPLELRGHFNCGSTTHFSTRDCSLGQSGNFNKRNFFAGLWTHKPHTKKPKFNSKPKNSDNSHNQKYSTNGESGHTLQHSKKYHFFDDNNDFNHHQRSDQNLNAIGDDRLNDQQVSHNNGNLTSQSNVKNVSFNDQQTRLMSNTTSPDLSQYQNNRAAGERDIDNSPAWTKNKDASSRKPRLFVMNGTLLNVASTPDLRAMPLPLDNVLPAAVLRF